MGEVMQEAAPYPRELVRTVTLKDGFATRIRPIRADDEPRLVDLYDEPSEEPDLAEVAFVVEDGNTRTQVEDRRTQEGVTGVLFRRVPADATPR